MTDILSGLGSAVRGVAKGFIKGGVYLYDSVSDVASEAGAQWKDLVAEAKVDLEKPNGELEAERAEQDVDKGDGQNGNGRKTREHRTRSRMTVKKTR